MYTDLENMMKKKNWSGIDATRKQWDENYKKRKIISEFIKDDLIGLKRLTSMPDRVTNTITVNTVKGATATAAGDMMRPTVINCYENSLDTSEKWWSQWKTFMFETIVSSSTDDVKKTPADLLSKISHAKYPSITEDEEKISIPLQSLSIAIFDAILVHVMNSLDKNWHSIRDEICSNLNRHKTTRVIEILSSTYAGYDIHFLQEVGQSFLNKMKTSNSLSDHFDMITSVDLDTSRDQNSVILLRKGKFKNVEEITTQVVTSYNGEIEHAEKPLPLAKGDLLVISVEDDTDVSPTEYILASFHGDTNGLATKPVLTSVHDYAIHSLPQHKVIFGMDANTYTTPLSDQQGVVDFAMFYNSINMNSCYGHKPNPTNFTTFHARTFLQPQLNKAITLEEKDIKGDKNPKDFIIFFNGDFSIVQTRKDNTGKMEYVEGMVFPTLSFPSDHGITSTILVENHLDAAIGK